MLSRWLVPGPTPNPLQGVRGFAEAAAADPHLPPQFSVAGRYANALYVSAAKAGKLDAVTSELGQMSSLLQQSDDFREFVADPTVSQKVKVEGMDSVMSGLGTSDITKNFFALLADNSRLNEVDKILEAFQSIVAQQRGEVHATVTSASVRARWLSKEGRGLGWGTPLALAAPAHPGKGCFSVRHRSRSRRWSPAPGPLS